MGGFHVLKIVKILLNHAKHLIWAQSKKVPKKYILLFKVSRRLRCFETFDKTFELKKIMNWTAKQGKTLKAKILKLENKRKHKQINKNLKTHQKQIFYVRVTQDNNANQK